MSKAIEDTKHRRYNVVLTLSGGLDSVVMLYDYVTNEQKMRAIYLDFGKPSSKREIASAKFHALQLGIPLDIVPVHGLTDMTMGFVSLVDQLADELDVKEYETDDGLLLRRARVDEARVSGFHVVLSITAYYAQILGVGRIAYAVTKEQTDGIIGLRESFGSIKNGIEKLNPDAGTINFETPMASLEKSEIVAKGSNLGVPLDCTWSCLLGGVAHCGRCRQCLARKDAFEKSNSNDPTVYRDQRPDLEFLRG